MNNNIVVASYKGLIISARQTDGWVNLTQMCNATGKKLNDFLRLKQTKAYISTLTSDTGKVASDFLEVVKGGDPKKQGSWGHPEIAILLAQWISPEFHRWCNSNIFVLINDGEIKRGLNPFDRMEEILDKYRRLNLLMENDDRFDGVDDYSNWSL